MRVAAMAGIAALCLLAGCSGPGGTFAASRQAVTVDPGPGGGHEVGVRMAEGQSFTYSWNATGILKFNVHSHRDGTVYEWRQAAGVAGSGTFQSPLAGEYYLYWTNEGRSRVAVTYSVHGEGTRLL